VFAVPLEGGKYGFGRCLVDPVVEFYDIEADDPDDLEVEDIVGKDVAFTIWVMHKAVNSWKKLGQVALSPAERRRKHEFFKQDSISKKLVRYYTDAHGEQHEEPIGLAEARGLESAAVWSAPHVVSRLEDHFAARTNRFWESMRPKEA